MPRQLWEHNAVSQAAKQPPSNYLSQSATQWHRCALEQLYWHLEVSQLKQRLALNQPLSCVIFLTTHRKEKLSSCQLKMLKPDCRDGIIFSKLGKCQSKANKLFFMDASTGNKFTSPRGWVAIGLFCCIWLPSSIWYVRVDKVLADNTLGEELLYYYIFIAKCLVCGSIWWQAWHLSAYRMTLACKSDPGSEK